MYLRQKLQQRNIGAGERELLQNRLRNRADQNAEIVGRLHSCLYKDGRLLSYRLALSRRETPEHRRRLRQRCQGDVPIWKYAVESWGIFGSWRR